MVDNLITLFESDATTFTTNGLGSLNKAVSCVVIENRNGEYELELVYPVEVDDLSKSGDSILMDNTRQNVLDYSGSDISIATRPLTYEEIKFNRIIFAKPNPYSDPQPFRIYSMSKPIDGLVTINAQHISYDLSGVAVSPYSADSVTAAFQQIKSHAIGNCPFTFWTDKTSTGSIGTSVPSSMRSILGGSEGSILDIYGGEYEFDKFTVKLHENRGTDRGVTIRYGKNLTDLKQDENCSEVYTKVYPYWYSQDEEGNEILVQLDEKTVSVEGEFDHEKILTLDMTEYFDDQPTKDELRYMTQLYINAYDIGVPDISLTVSFVPLSDTEEYKDYALLEQVCLCDTVSVEFSRLKVSATAKCISTKYDVISGKYISIELGNARSDLSSSFASVKEAINQMPTKSFLEQAIETATSLITGQEGGYVVLNPSNQPQELLVMDSPVISEATRVWRWNAGGLGYSSHGYNGPYSLAMTMDGSIVADFINTGTLNANLIKTGYLSDRNNTNYWNLDTGKALFTNLKVKQSLSLVDTNGYSRLKLGYDANSNSYLRFYDGVHPYTLLSLGANIYNGITFPQLALNDINGRFKIDLDGQDNRGNLFMFDQNNICTTWLGSDTYGGNLQVRNASGYNSAVIDSNGYGGRFTLSDRDGYDFVSMFKNDTMSVLNVDGNIYGNYMGKRWVRLFINFDSIAVNRTWGSIYCSLEKKVSIESLGLTTIDNVFMTAVTMNGGMWCWVVNTKQDSDYIYYVLARPTSDTCNQVKVSMLVIGT